MNRIRTRKGFTIIELLIVVIVIGILAAAGLAKYQNFAETSRRKTCLGQIQTIENAMAVWETTNQAFAEDSKTAFGFSTRTGLLTDTSPAPTAFGAGILQSNSTGTVGSIADTQTTRGGPQAFYNSQSVGPLGAIIRDDKVWVCPSALSRYYGGEVQNVHDTYMDTQGTGVIPSTRSGTSIGLGGRYFACVAGRGNVNVGNTPISNGGYPAGWITGISTATSLNTGAPCPQTPFKLVMCGCYGTFGPSAAALTTGTGATNQGGPVGPDGSSLNRHSSRW